MQLTLWHKAMIFSLVLNISAFGLIGYSSRFNAQQQPLTEIIVDLSLPVSENTNQIDGHFSSDNIESTEVIPSPVAGSFPPDSSDVIQQEQSLPNISTNASITGSQALSTSYPVNSTAVPNKSSAPQAGSMGVTPPKVLSRLQPVYPEQARKNGVSGTVKVKALVLKDGSVGECFVIGSSGYPELDEAALNAVQAWQFSPAIDRATKQPVKSYVVLPVLFSLNER